MGFSFKNKRFDSKQASENIIERYQEVERRTLSHLHKYLVRRWSNFKEAGVAAFLWLFIVAAAIVGVFWQTGALSKVYTTTIPAAGGTYSEGVVGRVENVNPLFASSQAEMTVSKLVFSGLLKYDERNRLTGDLASGWQVNESGTEYTVTLRSDLRWHDGAAITSEDVEYTIKMIQQESTRSPLAASWRRVEVAAVDDRTVRFTLPAPFPPFLHSLTLGIVPEHILGDSPPAQLRTSSFNTQPFVGSGPFVFQDVRSVGNHQEVRLNRNNDYYSQPAMLDRFVVFAYGSYEDLVNAFNNQSISAAAGLRAEEVASFEGRSDVVAEMAPLQHISFAFFKMTQPILQDVKVRQALALATDNQELAEQFNGLYRPANLPLLPGQLGYDAGLDTNELNLERARQLLDEAGWQLNADGQREKEGRLLELNLVASSNDEYPEVAAALQRQWQALGIAIKTDLVRPSDFQQNVIIPHNYDILLYELAIGQDADVYAYWHSTQAVERGLNLSEYKSLNADVALEGGRSNTNPDERSARYRSFLEEWKRDVPAVALYQPGYGYVYRASVAGFINRTLVDPTDRLFNVTDWTAAKKEATATW